MPSASSGFGTLRRMVAARAGGQFVADELETRAMAQLAAGGGSLLLGALRGSTVLLATDRQMETLAAMIQLDGVARRIVLWPGDRPRAQINSVMRAAGVDHVVNDWKLGGEDAAPEYGGGETVAPLVTEFVLFTSGTTSQPKMVVHTLESLSGHLWDAATVPGTVWGTYYDIRRYGGLQVALRALFGGCSLVLSGAPGERPAAFLARAGSAGVTHVLGTPSHWRGALMSDAAGAIAPRYVRLSGEVADQMILDQLAASYPGAEIVHAFASTEAGLAFEIGDRRAGFPAACAGEGGSTSIAVMDGTLRVRSPRNAAGYLDGGISRIADAAGFVDTGDAVELRSGRYHFAGRCDGTINVGGQKVHPEEVEAVINLHPQVRMCLVAGRHSPITGAVIVARIVAREAAAPPAARRLEEEIRLLCRQHLPAHKVPAAISMVAALEMSAAGKLRRPRA